ncbi:hypothetical protein SK128_000835 [Halocaridina rubra]|uniref:Uncharacterized protein n=1 Tax=Halocaridina rubra TaxID=373956 RepID=A0AAN8XAZ6_HALRR
MAIEKIRNKLFIGHFTVVRSSTDMRRGLDGRISLSEGKSGKDLPLPFHAKTSA